MNSLLQHDFIGTYELRQQLPWLLKKLQKEGGSVVVTQRGRPAALLLDIESYLSLEETVAELQSAIKELQDPKYMATLMKARDEIDNGKGMAAKKVYQELDI